MMNNNGNFQPRDSHNTAQNDRGLESKKRLEYEQRRGDVQ